MSELLRVSGATLVLFARTVRSIRREGLSFRQTLVQAYSLGASSALLVAMGMSFFGVVVTSIARASRCQERRGTTPPVRRT